MKRSPLALPLLLIIAAGAAIGAGPLEPPAGGVLPTMKPLDQLEPRIAIDPIATPGDDDSMFRIAKPGSYYLTGNFIGERGKAGIEIAASGVTLDLMGFTLKGVQGSLDAITTDGPRLNLAVRNGTVSEWSGDGVDLSLAGDLSGACLVESVIATLNTGDGVSVGVGSIVRQCIATANHGTGIVADAASIVESCIARHNTSGVRVADHSTVRTTQTLGNFGPGLFAGPECSVSDSAARGNQAFGFHLQTGGTITSSAASANSADGFIVRDGVIRACTARDNLGAGIDAIGKCVVQDNTSEDHEHAPGIRVFGDASRIKGNNVSANEVGILVEGKNTLVVANVASLNTRANFQIEASNRVGPIVVPVKSGAITDSTGSAGLGSADPWANFAY